MDINACNDVPSGQIASLVARLKSEPPFDAHTTQIAGVPVSEPITPSLTVTVPRLARRASFSKTTRASDLFRAMLEGGSTSDPIYRQTLGASPNGGAMMYTSYDEDLRLHPLLVGRLRLNEGDQSSPTAATELRLPLPPE
jgi:hypothetical protein